jgi:SH3 domain-containing YSC84-like protein 1
MFICRSFFSALALLGAVLVAPVALRADVNVRFVDRVETCEAILREFQADAKYAIPAEVLRGAHAIVVINQVKAGLILGGRAGYGVVLARRDDGTWSVPVVIKAGEASFGLQLGGGRHEAILIFTSHEALQPVLVGEYKIGVDAAAVAGPRVAETEKFGQLLSTPVLVYTRDSGLYAGANVKSGWLRRHDALNWDYYQTPYVLPELLYGNYVQPTAEVRYIMDFVTQITR